MRLNLVTDVSGLSHHLTTKKCDLALLDTSVPSRPGGFDAVDAAVYVRKGQTSANAVLWTDKTASSLHVAEEVLQMFRPKVDQSKVMSVACPLGQCIEAALECALRHQTWSDKDLPDDFMLPERRSLYTELKARNAVPDILIAVAAKPELTWKEMATELKRDDGALKNALNEQVKPALARLNWIKEDDPLTSPHLAALVHQRRDYVEYFAARHRVDMQYLFAA